MSAYIISNYRITNPDGYRDYPQLAGPTILPHGGELLVADYESEAADGSPAPVTVVIRFPSREAAKAWYESDQYQKVRHLRTDNCDGFLTICDEFVAPS